MIAKAELECTENTGNPLSEVTLKAFAAQIKDSAAQIKDSLREELCSLSATNSDPGNRQSKNRRQQPAQQLWQRPQQQQWQQPVPQLWQRPQQQQWQQYPHQPPQQQWQQTPQQQWQQTPTAAHGNQRGRSCPGCGKSCYPRYSCPAYNHFSTKCDTWSHFEEVCRGLRRKQNFALTRQHYTTNQSQ